MALGPTNTLVLLHSFVAKELDEQFYCYVFRCTSKEKAYAVALTLAKAFYLAYQVSVYPHCQVCFVQRSHKENKVLEGLGT